MYSIKRILSAGLLVSFIVFVCGCQESVQTARNGYLSDYSRLQAKGDGNLRYFNQRALNNYNKFIVDVVDMYSYQGNKPQEFRPDETLTEEMIRDLRNYMHSRMVEAVKASGNEVVYSPEVGVARIRTAITDIDKSTVFAFLPSSRLLGAGVGGISLESEIIDSKTGVQLGAIVESQVGTRVPFAEMANWGIAQQAMDGWGSQFQKRMAQTK